MKIAIISGVSGQDGSYLAEFLAEKEYIIYGLLRASSKLHHLKHFTYQHFYTRVVDMTDTQAIQDLIAEIKNAHHAFDRLEIYNLASQSHVKVSFDAPEYTADVGALGSIRFLEAIRKHDDIVCKTRFYQACTSELFGKAQEVPQRESTPFYPRSPYAVSKLYSYWMTKLYRETYSIYACNGLLFNHESERRGEEFVTRKITKAVARLIRERGPPLELGNLDTRRDWGHAEDYVRGMWMMMQHDIPGDYIMATGETHSVREFVEEAFRNVGINIAWRGKHENEEGYDHVSGRILIKVNPIYYRPIEGELLVGDPAKSYETFGWCAEISFNTLVKRMVDHDCN